MKTICVIPAWNEEKNITKVIKDVTAYVDQVVVVDDYSSDQTAALAKQAGATLLQHIINRGQGAALQTGNDYALANGAEIIIHFDGDDQFLAKEIPSLTAPIKSGRADIVFGSRFLGKKSNLPAVKEYIIMPLAKIFMRLVMRVKLSDPQNGFRALNRRAATLIRIDNRSMAHASEIQAKAFASKLAVSEVPVTVTYHEFGQRLGGGLKVIKDLLINKLIKPPQSS